MVITELLQNATQYGKISDQADCAGLIRVKWQFSPDSEDDCLTLAISNPATKLFNPAKYCNLKIEEYLSCVADGSNGHAAVSTLVAYLGCGRALCYLWDLTDGGKIVCSLSAINPEAADAAAAEITIPDDIVMPVKVSVSKYSNDGDSMPYTTDEFLRDVASGLRTETVTVAGIFAKGSTAGAE